MDHDNDIFTIFVHYHYHYHYYSFSESRGKIPRKKHPWCSPFAVNLIACSFTVDVFVGVFKKFLEQLFNILTTKSWAAVSEASLVLFILK